MKKGDIILIPFPFTDLIGSKNRPALVLISSQLDVTVSFLSTQLKWKEPFDLLIEASEENGLKKESLLRTTKIATIQKSLVIGKLGILSKEKLNELDLNLKSAFQLH